MAPPQEAWLLLHALAQRSASDPGSAPPGPGSAQCLSTEQESVERLCKQHWRLCVQTCGSAEWMQSVLSCAGLAHDGLAGAAVDELVKRRCEILMRQHEQSTLGQGCNPKRPCKMQPCHA